MCIKRKILYFRINKKIVYTYTQNSKNSIVSQCSLIFEQPSCYSNPSINDIFPDYYNYELHINFCYYFR